MSASIVYEGKRYSVENTEEDQLVKRGLLDVYDLTEDPDEWLVLEPYIFWSARLKNFIIAPRWFITDLSSIPQIFRSVIPVNDRHRLPSLPHDVIYALKDIEFCDKKTGDLIYKDFSKLYKVPSWKRFSMYNAVKFGGRSSWESPSLIYAPLEHRHFYMKHATNKLRLIEEAGSFFPD